MVYFKEAFFAFFLVLCLVVQQLEAFQNEIGLDYDGVLSVRLEHALNNEPVAEFTDRGSVTIQSVRSGAVALQQIALTTAAKQKLKKLGEADGLYRIRSYVRSSDGKEMSFLSFVKACALIESLMSDIITVTLDHTGSPIAVSLATSPSLCLGNDVSNDDLTHFNTSVFIRTMEQGPVPDTASYIQKIEREKESQARGEIKDNRSFIAKYWMYIVPVVIFVVLSGASNPDGGAAGGGGGAAR